MWAAVKASTNYTPATPQDDEKGRDVWRAQAQALIQHIVSNSLVTVTVTTTGTAAAQAGGGTGTIS
jgi:hypothetical protein